MEVTIRVSVVEDKHGAFMGYEMRAFHEGNEDGAEVGFYAGNQWLWPGFRAGPFPCNKDGQPFARRAVGSFTHIWGSESS